jgi:spore maturation protein CgeB
MDVIYASNPDLVLTMCPEMCDLMRSKQIPCEMMHYAYCPLMHHPISGIESENGPISLIGNCYSMHYQSHPDHYRYQSIRVLLKPLLENGYEVQFYGDPAYRSLIFKMLNIDVPKNQFHGYVAYEKTCGIYNSAFINIVTQNHKNTITKRTFEILGSGGFVLSSNNSALGSLFTPGRDLAVSSSPEETLELVEYYKTHPDDYRQVRENAVRSVENHTYKQRADYILELYRQKFSEQH